MVGKAGFNDLNSDTKETNNELANNKKSKQI